MKTLTLIIALFIPALAHAQEARVLNIVDGDTIKVMYQGKVEKVRLIGVDTPKRGQPGYKGRE